MKKKEKNSCKWWSYLIPFFIGIITFYVTQQILTYLNRPIINIEPQTIILYDEYDGNWKFDLSLKVINKGNSKAIFRVTNLELRFDSLSNQIYSFKIDSTWTLGEKMSVNKNISKSFPPDFKKIEFGFIPNLDTMNIKIIDLINDSKFNFSLDSNNILYRLVLGKETLEPHRMRDVLIDSVKNQISFLTKPFYIEYKGTKYLNQVYPKNVNLKYGIKNDNIYIEYSQVLGTTNLQGEFRDIGEFQFFPHPDIENKIVLPTKMKLSMSVYKTVDGNKVFEDYTFEPHIASRNYCYILR